METPSVVAVMLMSGRDAMVQRAIKSFRAQTYPQKQLFILDTTPNQAVEDGIVGLEDVDDLRTGAKWTEKADGRTVGTLRNRANGLCLFANPDIFVHWDSDDWSHPRRIEEQVELLTSRKLCCVGYRDALFWETTLEDSRITGPLEAHFGSERAAAITNASGKAWLYENKDPQYMIGASLCYRRSFWEVNPFPDAPKRKGATGEDTIFIKAANRIGVSSFIERPSGSGESHAYSGDPRLVCSIHGANTQYYNPAEYVEKQSGTSWARAEAWDEHCRGVMSL